MSRRFEEKDFAILIGFRYTLITEWKLLEYLSTIWRVFTSGMRRRVNW
jgi:hypothetical protein